MALPLSVLIAGDDANRGSSLRSTRDSTVVPPLRRWGCRAMRREQCAAAYLPQLARSKQTVHGIAPKSGFAT